VSAAELPAGYKDPNGYWASVRLHVFGPAVNTDLVKPADWPKTYNDLLDPKWGNGQINFKDSASGLQYNQYVMLAKLYGDSWWDKLALQKPVALAGIAQQFEKTLTVIATEHIAKDVRHHPHAGIDQADVPAGPAKADLHRLEQRDIGACLGEMERGRQTGIPAADDGRVDPDRSLQSARFRGRWRGQLPKTVGSGVV